MNKFRIETKVGGFERLLLVVVGGMGSVRLYRGRKSV